MKTPTQNRSQTYQARNTHISYAAEEAILLENIFLNDSKIRDGVEVIDEETIQVSRAYE